LYFVFVGYGAAPRVPQLYAIRRHAIGPADAPVHARRQCVPERTSRSNTRKVCLPDEQVEPRYALLDCRRQIASVQVVGHKVCRYADEPKDRGEGLAWPLLELTGKDHHQLLAREDAQKAGETAGVLSAHNIAIGSGMRGPGMFQCSWLHQLIYRILERARLNSAQDRHAIVRISSGHRIS